MTDHTPSTLVPLTSPVYCARVGAMILATNPVRREDAHAA